MNCAHGDDSTDLGRLVHDIKCSDCTKMYSEVLAKRAKSVKSIISFEEGEDNVIMTVTEELRQEAMREGREAGRREGMMEGGCDVKVQIAKTMIADDMPLDKVVKYSGLSSGEVESIAASCGRQGVISG